MEISVNVLTKLLVFGVLLIVAIAGVFIYLLREKLLGTALYAVFAVVFFVNGIAIVCCCRFIAKRDKPEESDAPHGTKFTHNVHDSDTVEPEKQAFYKTPLFRISSENLSGPQYVQHEGDNTELKQVVTEEQCLPLIQVTQDDDYDNMIENINSDVTKDVSENATSYSYDVGNNVTSDVANNYTAEVTNDVKNDVKNNVTNDVTNNVTNDVVNNVKSGTTDDATNNTAEKVTNDIANNVTNDKTSEVKDNVTSLVTNNAAINVTSDLTNKNNNDNSAIH